MLQTIWNPQKGLRRNFGARTFGHNESMTMNGINRAYVRNLFIKRALEDVSIILLIMGLLDSDNNCVEV